MRALLQAALDYAARGLAVFPLVAKTKEPATRRGFYDAVSNPATIRRWFGNVQDYNIAVRTGLISRVWVLDVDGATGATTLNNLEAEHGPLPSTLTSISSSGFHLWFRALDELPSSDGRIGRCIDVRADGAYIVAPPSVHPDGPTYRWSNQIAPALAPEWLVALARKRPVTISEHAVARMHSRSASNGPPGAYGQAALDREIDELSKAPRGCRNHALNRASFYLHQLVAGGELDEAEVHDRLIDAATANGLMTDPADGPRKVIATIRSGARAGMQHPRSRSGAA